MSAPGVQSEHGDLDGQAVEVPEAHVSKTDQIAALLRRSQPDAESVPEGEPSAEDQPAEKWDAATVAGKLGVDPAKLYDLEIPLADGEILTLGALKDQLKDRKAWQQEREQYTEERGHFKADQIRAERELGKYLASIPREHVSPELLKEHERQLLENASREREALFRKVPEWADERIRAKDAATIKETAKKFGWTTPEVELVQDHRWYVAMRRLAQLEAMVSKEPAAPAPKAGVKPKPRATSTPAQELGRIKAAVTTGRLTRTEAIGKILRRG